MLDTCPVLATHRCTSCQLDKSIFDFGTNRRKSADGTFRLVMTIYCRQCQKLKTQAWRRQHPEKVRECNETTKAKKKRWEEQHPRYQERRSYFQQYYVQHLSEIKKQWATTGFKNYKRQYKKFRRQRDPIFRMRENVSNAILRALKKGKSDKAGQSIIHCLGYTIQELKEHLGNLFDQQMTWENYGKYWHIDHIIPQSDLPYASMTDDNFKACWALTNLRPLEAKQNIREGASRSRHKKVSPISE